MAESLAVILDDMPQFSGGPFRHGYNRIARGMRAGFEAKQIVGPSVHALTMHHSGHLYTQHSITQGTHNLLCGLPRTEHNGGHTPPGFFSKGTPQNVARQEHNRRTRDPGQEEHRARVGFSVSPKKRRGAYPEKNDADG